MSDSIALHLGRDGFVHMFNLADVPHFDTYPPIFDIIFSVIAAGYRGVLLEEKQLENGRFLVGLNADPTTPEGQIIQDLVLAANHGVPIRGIAVELCAGSINSEKTIACYIKAGTERRLNRGLSTTLCSARKNKN